jgi:RNA polymerase sigma factor (sigma-70 family)
MAHAQLDRVLRHLRTLRETHAAADAPDAELVERFTARREEAAFAALLRRHGPMVLGVSQRILHTLHDAEDVFQATFLLLARKAASIQKRASVAAWLHGVAHRLALRAKQQRTCRRTHEQRAADMRNATPNPDSAWQNVQAALDQALNELPEKYRAALVLCYLEGKSHAEAAAQLGCPLTTLRTQIARGRKLLRERLVKHGLTLSATGVASLLLASTAPAAMPIALTKTTLAAALAFAAGNQPTALLSQQAAGLVEGGLRTMFISKTKIATAIILLASLTAACGLAWSRSASENPAAPAEKPKEAHASAKPQPAKGAVDLSGRVVDLDGKPVVGAKVYYHFITREEVPIPVRATTDTDGRFAFTLTQSDVPLSAEAGQNDPLKTGHVIVKADGYTYAWRAVAKQTTDLGFQVARDDTPLEGRILDLQGKPLAGLNVGVWGMAATDKGDLTPFLNALKAREGLYNALAKHLPNHFHNPLIMRQRVPILPTATTDAMGRFRLKGFAKEQLIELRIEGAAIETQALFVLSRAKPADAEALLTLPRFKSEAMHAYGPQEQAFIRWNGFDHAAPPGQVVTGLVRDESTKAPIPRAIIESYMLAGTNLAQNTIYHTVADEQGRFRFTGLPRGKGTQLRIRPPKDQPHIPLVKSVPAQQPFIEAAMDVDLPRGVFVDVTVKDKKTGEPVPGSVSYFTFPDNPDPKIPFQLGPYADSYDNFMTIPNDGTFRFVAAPRKAIVAIRTDWSKYPIAREAATIKIPGSLSTSNFQAFATIEPTADDATVKVDFVLDTGGVVKGRVVDPEGNPLSGVLPSGLRHDWFFGPESKLTTAEFTALGLDPKQPRLLCFAHWDKNLAGSVVVRGDEKGPVTVKLVPWGSVRGRLLDADGKPIKNATLWFTEVPRLKLGQPRALDVGIHVVDRSGYKPSPDPRSDEEGRFTALGLVPGLKYNLALPDTDGAFDYEQIKWKGLAFSDLVLKPGETKDLGDVKLQPFPKH